MSVTASPARATASWAAATNDRPDGYRRSSDVCDKNTRRGGGSLGTTHSIPACTQRENTNSRSGDGEDGRRMACNRVTRTPPCRPVRLRWRGRRTAVSNARVLPNAQRFGMGTLVWGPAVAITHAGVTCALLGARTQQHLDDLLAGLDVTLSDDVLDRIDEIVPPGTDVGALDQAYQPPALEDSSLRRRPLDARAAA